MYYIYDPITDGWHCDSNLKLYMPGEEPQTDHLNFYAINEAYVEIRNDLNFKFLKEFQVKRQITYLYKTYRNKKNKILAEA